MSSVTIQALTTLGALIPGCSYTINFTGATSTGIVVPLNFSIPAGTGHRLVMSNNSTTWLYGEILPVIVFLMLWELLVVLQEEGLEQLMLVLTIIFMIGR